MITGAQAYWIIEVGTVLTAEKAHSADGLWGSLDKFDQDRFDSIANLFNTLLEAENAPS